MHSEDDRVIGIDAKLNDDVHVFLRPAQQGITREVLDETSINELQNEIEPAHVIRY